MRWLSLFFALYFSVLSSLACTDGEVCAAPAQAELHATPLGQSAGHVLGDWCSPLCQCHCYPGAALPVASVVLAQPGHPADSPLTYAAVAAPAVAAQAPAPLWQPPQRA